MDLSCADILCELGVLPIATWSLAKLQSGCRLPRGSDLVNAYLEVSPCKQGLAGSVVIDKRQTFSLPSFFSESRVPDFGLLLQAPCLHALFMERQRWAMV